MAILQLADVYTLSIKGVANQLKNFFPDVTTPVVIVYNNNHMRAIARKYTEMKFPYFAIQRQSININKTDGMAARNLQRTGVYGDLNKTSTALFKYHLIPAEVTLKIIFLCQSVKDEQMFTQYWLISAAKHDNKFYIQSDNYSIPITMWLEESLTLPDFENDDIGETFTFETSIRLTTFVGTVESVNSGVSQAVSNTATNLEGTADARVLRATVAARGLL